MIIEGWWEEGVVGGMQLNVTQHWANAGLAGHFILVPV